MKKHIFTSDNCSGVHPEIVNYMCKATDEHDFAYGDDKYTRTAINLFKDHFGDDIDVHFVANGTAANTLAIKKLLKSHEALICSECAHLNENECGAIEAIVGSKVLPIKSSQGKIHCDNIKPKLNGLGNLYLAQPKLISLTQATEFGTVYSIDELSQIKEFAKKNQLFLYMDGARLANAAAHLNTSLKKICDGFDAVFFGSTKNGGMFGEALIFLNSKLSQDFRFIQKQNLQLIPKTKFIAAQYIALLKDNLWLKNALNSNRMAQILSNELALIPGVTILYPTEANLVFAQVNPGVVQLLLENTCLSVVDEKNGIIRLATSFDTNKNDILHFTSLIKQLMYSNMVRST